MPTQKFFNLSAQKQQAILEAMRDEFLRYPYADIRISRVIQRAGISRASFYLYFEDKDDLFAYMLYREGEKMEARLAEIFREERGIFYNAMKRLFLMVLEDDAGKIGRALYRRVQEDESCKNIALRMEKKMYSGEIWKKYCRDCYSVMDRSLYPGLEEDSFGCATDLGLMIIVQAMIMSAGGAPAEVLKNTALKQLRILEQGLRV